MDQKSGDTHSDSVCTNDHVSFNRDAILEGDYSRLMIDGLTSGAIQLK